MKKGRQTDFFPLFSLLPCVVHQPVVEWAGRSFPLFFIVTLTGTNSGWTPTFLFPPSFLDRKLKDRVRERDFSSSLPCLFPNDPGTRGPFFPTMNTINVSKMKFPPSPLSLFFFFSFSPLTIRRASWARQTSPLFFFPPFFFFRPTMANDRALLVAVLVDQFGRAV